MIIWYIVRTFQNIQYYIISAIAGNYKHLTGVNSHLTPHDFFQKCIDHTLTCYDFDFCKKGESEKFVKGVVRNKIIALSKLSTFLNERLTAVENFSCGAVSCTLAATDSQITVGFEQRISARLKSLLRGNLLSNSSFDVVDISLVLRRDRGNLLFDTVVQGDTKQFSIDHFNSITYSAEGLA